MINPVLLLPRDYVSGKRGVVNAFKLESIYKSAYEGKHDQGLIRCVHTQRQGARSELV